jgi:hypothetical protein
VTLPQDAQTLRREGVDGLPAEVQRCAGGRCGGGQNEGAAAACGAAALAVCEPASRRGRIRQATALLAAKSLPRAVGPDRAVGH